MHTQPSFGHIEPTTSLDGESRSEFYANKTESASSHHGNRRGENLAKRTRGAENIHVVEEVGAAGAAVEVPGDDGVLGGGVHAAAPAPEHALPLQPLQEEQPHPRNAPPPLSPDQLTDQLELGSSKTRGKRESTGPGSRLPRKEEKIRNLSLKRWLPRRDDAERRDANGV